MTQFKFIFFFQFANRTVAAARWRRNLRFCTWWEIQTLLLGDEINYVILISISRFTLTFGRDKNFPQYAGFLTVILVIELAIAASLYTYKDHIADGLQKGLNHSIRNYGPVQVIKSADFDAMQENVNV